MKYHSQSSVAQWCGVVALASGCTLNVDPESVTRTATYAETGWTTFRAVAWQNPATFSVRGHAGADATASATIGALVAGNEPQGSLDTVSLALIREEDSVRPELHWTGPPVEGVGVLDLQADVPSAAALDLDLPNTEITVAGMAGTVRAVSSNGRVSVETAGTVDLSTSNGPVTASGAGGSVMTSNGSVEFTWTGASLGDLRVETSNGGVKLRVPAGAGFVLDLATSNGGVAVRVDGMDVQDSRYAGEIRGGGPRVTVRTSNGSIEVVE